MSSPVNTAKAEEIRLTQYAHGAGCGCKIAPHVLKTMLSGSVTSAPDKKLLVANESNDDAAVYDLGNGTGLISTTDFFTPIVDDAFDFGKVAAANAISDVYAMGGVPVMALAIMGWPVEQLPAELAARVTDGARSICNEAGIVLAGGHTIDNREPVFGLSVNGFVNLDNLKRNSTAKAGDHIMLTKPIGTGIFSTAGKRGQLKEEHRKDLIRQLCTLNKIGAELAKIKGVTAMTDVTGFGLLGHLLEVCNGANISADLYYSLVPKMKDLDQYLALNTVPDATYRNWNAYQGEVSFDEDVDMMHAFTVLPDPQTNGGILFTVSREALSEAQRVLDHFGLQDHRAPIGITTPRGEKTLKVKK
jgi:selenide,water dikinase